MCVSQEDRGSEVKIHEVYLFPFGKAENTPLSFELFPRLVHISSAIHIHLTGLPMSRNHLWSLVSVLRTSFYRLGTVISPAGSKLA